MELSDYDADDHSSPACLKKDISRRCSYGSLESRLEVEESRENDSLLCAETITNNNDNDSEYESCAGELFTEKIEDVRNCGPESVLRCRSSCSRPAQVTEGSSLAGSVHSLKAKVEEKLLRSLCKDCLRKSIEAQLQKLGLAPSTDVSCNTVNVVETNMDSANATSEGNVDSEGLLQTIHRRTKSLSEIDWHEITRFAQGDLFDPDSSTAKEVKRLIAEGREELSLAFKLMHSVDLDMVVEEAERCVQCVISTGWNVVSHWELPQWLRDNDFLWHMHRPQLPSFKECFGSMFRVHTETGNIWTHFFGMILVVIASAVIYTRPVSSFSEFPHGWEENCVFAAFFIGAFMCLMFSWLYHTCYCHSEKTSKLFSKLDYTGIAFMIMGSFVPCMYYGFYCRNTEKLVYMVAIMVLGIACIIVSLWDKFATPTFRPVRAGVFLALGCSGVVPCIHVCFLYGFIDGVEQAALGWLLLMGIMYIVGALLYALRVPERFFPGKCNIYFQSHQIFHVLVVVAAFIHLHGCCQMALYRIRKGRVCPGEAVAQLEKVLMNSTLTTYNSTLEFASHLL